MGFIASTVHRNDTGTTCLLFCQALPRTAHPPACLHPSSPAPSPTALSGCPSRLPPASPFFGRGQALLLLRVFVGVTRRPGPGPDSPRGGRRGCRGRGCRQESPPGTGAAKKNRLFYTLFKKCINFGVFNRYYTNLNRKDGRKRYRICCRYDPRQLCQKNRIVFVYKSKAGRTNCFQKQIAFKYISLVSQYAKVTFP